MSDQDVRNVIKGAHKNGETIGQYVKDPLLKKKNVTNDKSQGCQSLRFSLSTGNNAC